jgi:hypothetical protein
MGGLRANVRRILDARRHQPRHVILVAATPDRGCCRASLLSLSREQASPSTLLTVVPNGDISRDERQLPGVAFDDMNVACGSR